MMSMRDRRLRRLFERYRRRGDAEALAAVFDETAPALIGLARRLGGRTGDAEDALQATFLTAIERRETYDASMPIEPWLTGILVRKTRQARQLAARGVEAERSSEHASPDPVEAASRAELEGELSRALAGLPERYRIVLQAFLHEDDRPREIARRLGLAPGTVRVQLHRGLGLLRKALPLGYSGALVGYVAPDGLARVRSAVLRTARETVPLAAPSALPVASLVGARALAGAGALVLGGVGAWQLMRPEPSRAGEEREASADGRPDRSAVSGDARAMEPSHSSVLRAGQRADGAAAAQRERAAAPERPLPASWTLTAEVSGLGASPPAGVRLRIRRSDQEGGASGAALELPLTADGPLEVRLAERLGDAGEVAPRLTLDVEHGAYDPFVLQTGEEHVLGPGEIRAGIALARSRSVLSGRVVARRGGSAERGQAGADVRQASVAFFPRPEGSAALDPATPLRAAQTVVCGSDGEFTLFVEEGVGWFAAVADACAPFGRSLSLTGFDQVELGTIELGPGAAIEGVAHSGGRPEPGAVHAENVAARFAPRAWLRETWLAFLEDGVSNVGGSAEVDAAGAFRVAGLTPGLHDVLFFAYTGTSGYFDPGLHGERVEAPVSGLRLESPIRVYTLLIESEGRPVADARVLFVLGDGNSVSGPSKVDGAYEFSMAVGDEPHRVVVDKPGFVARELALGPAHFDSDRRLRVELERSSPACELTLELGTRPATDVSEIGPLEVRMALQGSDWTLRRRTQPSGVMLALGEVPAGRYRVELLPELLDRVDPARQSRWLATSFELVCPAAGSERATVLLRAGGRVLFHVSGLGAEGPGIWRLAGPQATGSLAFLEWDAAQRAWRELWTPQDIERDGAYWLRPALEPGDYRLEVRYESGAGREVPFVVTAGDVTDAYVELE